MYTRGVQDRRYSNKRYKRPSSSVLLLPASFFFKKSGKFTEDEMTDWDKKMPGTGTDMIWNIFGEYVNGFPKFLALTTTMREFASTHNLF